MEQQLCDYLYICHVASKVKEISGEQDAPRDIYKVSRYLLVTLEMSGLCAQAAPSLCFD